LQFKVLLTLHMESSKHLQDISEIRSIMERSSTFLSLSGLSGLFAGLWAIFGAGFVYWYLFNFFPSASESLFLKNYSLEFELIAVLFMVAVFVFTTALISGIYFTYRNSKRKGLKLWSKTAVRLLVNLFIPIITGGFLVLIFFIHKDFKYIAPTMLIFYGLGLVSASKFTVRDIRYLGISEIVLGLAAALLLDYDLLFWTIGFGVLHVIYGGLMYFKYERGAVTN